MPKNPNRKTVPQRIRFEVLQRDGFRCRYCGAEPDQKALRVDHLVPLDKGGTDDADNLVTACDDCNGGKGSKLLPIGNNGKSAKPGNREKSGKSKKANQTSWKPGQSGNLNGRPKLGEDQLEARRQAQAILDAHTPDAAWAAVDMITHFDPKTRAAGIANILDRSGLKGVNRHELTGKDGAPLGGPDLSKLSDAELKAYRALVAKTEPTK